MGDVSLPSRGWRSGENCTKSPPACLPARGGPARTATCGGTAAARAEALPGPGLGHPGGELPGRAAAAPAAEWEYRDAGPIRDAGCHEGLPLARRPSGADYLLSTVSTRSRCADVPKERHHLKTFQSLSPFPPVTKIKTTIDNGLSYKQSNANYWGLKTDRIDEGLKCLVGTIDQDLFFCNIYIKGTTMK